MHGCLVTADSDRVVAGTVRGVLVDEDIGCKRPSDPFEVTTLGVNDGRVLVDASDPDSDRTGRSHPLGLRGAVEFDVR